MDKAFCQMLAAPAALFKRIKAHGQLRPTAISCWNFFCPHTPNAHKRLISAPGKRIFSPDQRKKSLFFLSPSGKNCFAQRVQSLIKMRVAKSAFGDNARAPDFLVVAFFLPPRSSI
jgi:hypothetical protein